MSYLRIRRINPLTTQRRKVSKHNDFKNGQFFTCLLGDGKLMNTNIASAQNEQEKLAKSIIDSLTAVLPDILAGLVEDNQGGKITINVDPRRNSANIVPPPRVIRVKKS